MFSGEVEKECIGNEWVKEHLSMAMHLFLFALFKNEKLINRKVVYFLTTKTNFYINKFPSKLS